MLKGLRKLFGKAPVATRNFKASAGNRLTMDWIVGPLSADAAMRGHTTTLRSRSRDLERNNEWARGFLRSLENNVLGESGISLQMRVRDVVTNKADEIANDKIEMAFWQWGKPGKCELSGRLSWPDLQRLALRCMARDGEVLIRLVRNRTGLQLQVIEADLLDDELNMRASNGNDIRLGVEVDANRRPVAYHLLGRHPGDLEHQSTSRDRVRIPAADIIHLFRPERPDQTRGIPWLAASMARLRMLDGYAEAELVAARAGAAKMGFFTKQTPDGWTGEVDGDGNLSMDASPGTIEELPPGVSFESWNTDHPNSGYGDFVKSCLRGVATSLGISYNTLASDLEGVNYSSIRAGLLEEREVWKSIQRLVIDHLCERVFEEWLTIELLSGRLGLPFEKMWKFNAPEFRGRRWPWVDPKKDIEASIMAVENRHRSLRDVIAENGGDIFDVLRTAKADEELAASLGISLTPANPRPAPVQAEIDTSD